MTSNQSFIRVGVGAVLMMAMVVPMLALAESSTTPRERAPRTEGAGRGGAGTPFTCDSIDTMRGNALTRMSERATAIKGKPRLSGGVETGKTDRLAKLEANRSKHDSAREDRYASMRAKATTEAEKSAVEEFITTVEELVDERKDTIDTAITAFETGVTALKAKSDATVGSVEIEMKADINEIFDDVEASCTDTTTGQEVRAQIKTAMEILHSERKAKRAEYSFKSEFEALRTARQSESKNAGEEFKAGLELAKTKLKSAVAKPATNV